MEEMEDWTMILLPKMELKRGGKVIYIEELCCGGVKTQFPERRGEGCEGPGHDIAAMSGSPASLDAIIKMYSGEDSIKRKGYEIIDDGPNYISDHKCIVASQQLGSTEFCIFSYNIEGLCRKTNNDNMFYKRMNRFYKKMSGVKKGFIMCLQEVALQKPESLENTIDTLDRIKADFAKKIPRAVYQTDGYTGAIFYDSSVWVLLQTLEIRREGSEKRSNAYKFKCSDGEIWVANIHLKALLSTSSKLLQFVCNPGDTHTKELSNIIKKVEAKNDGFKTPVYMCGDYNNPADKTDLLMCALESPVS